MPTTSLESENASEKDTQTPTIQEAGLYAHASGIESGKGDEKSMSQTREEPSEEEKSETQEEETDSILDWELELVASAAENELTDRDAVSDAVPAVTKCLEWGLESVESGTLSQEDFEIIFGVSYTSFKESVSKTSDSDEDEPPIPWVSMSEGDGLDSEDDANEVDPKDWPFKVQMTYLKSFLDGLTGLAMKIHWGGSKLRYAKADEAYRTMMESTAPSPYETERLLCNALFRSLSWHVHLGLSPFYQTVRDSGPQGRKWKIALPQATEIGLFTRLRAHLQAMENSLLVRPSVTIVIMAKVCDFTRLIEIQKDLVKINVMRYFRILYTRKKWGMKMEDKTRTPLSHIPSLCHEAGKRDPYFAEQRTLFAKGAAGLSIDFKVPRGQYDDDGNSVASSVAEVVDYPSYRKMDTDDGEVTCNYCCVPIDQRYEKSSSAWRYVFPSPVF